jgi:hypothetical protein
MGFWGRIKQRVSQKSTFYNAPVPLNGDTYANLPNPGVGLEGDYHPNPNRLHAPYPLFKTSMDHLDEGSADPNIHRYPDTPSTQYFKETKDIPRDPVKVPAHGVFVPDQLRGLGWKQGFVPSKSRRAAMMASAPPPMLDRPIVEVTTTTGIQNKRTPVRLKAPKPYRRDD